MECNVLIKTVLIFSKNRSLDCSSVCVFRNAQKKLRSAVIKFGVILKYIFNGRFSNYYCKQLILYLRKLISYFLKAETKIKFLKYRFLKYYFINITRANIVNLDRNKNPSVKFLTIHVRVEISDT